MKKFNLNADTMKHIKALEKSLNAVRKEAETNDTLFHYQTLLYNFKSRLICYNNVTPNEVFETTPMR